MTTYFVDFTGGLDPNDGLTATTAWKNISKVAGFAFAVGDIVKFKRGEIWQRTTTFTLKPGVTYTDYGTGNMPVIEEADLWAGAWALDSGTIFKQTGVTTVDSANGMLWEDGVKGVRQTLKANITAAGSYFLDDAADTLYYWSRTGVGGDPTGRRVHVANNNSSVVMSGNGGTISNLWLRYAGNTLLTNTFSGGAQTGWVLDGCKFEGARVHGITQFGSSADSSLTVKNAEILNCGDSTSNGYALNYTDCINTLVENVTAHDCRRGILLNSTNVTTSNNTIKNSLAYNIGEDGILHGAGGKNDFIDHCVAHDCGLDLADRTGIKSFGLNTIISYCLSYNNNVAFKASNPSGHGFQLDAATFCTIHHCVAYGNAFGGFSVRGTDNKVYNCVGALNHRNGFNVFGAVNNLIVKNNLWAANGDAAIADAAAGRSAFYDNGNNLTGSTGVVVNGNTYQNFSGGGSFLVTWAATSYATFALFHAAVAAQEANGTEADPLFVNAAGNDFHLAGGSPVINTGLVVSGITDGFVGSAPDRGAFEVIVPLLTGTPMQRTWGN